MLKVEKLSEEFLESVTGGSKTASNVVGAVVETVCIAVLLVMLVGASVQVASFVYDSKATKANNHGNMEDYNKYHQKSERLFEIGSDITTLGITAAVRHYENS